MNNKKLFAKTLSFFMLFATTLSVSYINNKNEKTVHATSARDSYYSSYESSLSGKTGTSLQNQLSIIMGSTQTSVTSYGELKTKTILTDTDPMNEDNIIAIYSRKSVTGDWSNATIWNREHVWCKSLSNGLYTSVSDSNRNAGTDIHHLRPALISLNSTRGNTPYGEVGRGSGVSQLTDTGNYYTSSAFEPRDDIKGDVARILMYMYTRYSSSLTSSSDTVTGLRGNLQITDIMYTSAGTATAAWNMLVSWNELDPVDYLEMHRNDEAEKIQGNRNVFIDHPEFGRMCFGTYSGSGAMLDLSGTYDESKPSYVGVNKRELYIGRGEGEQITSQVFPSGTSTTLTWASENENIAIVSNSGKIIGVAEGTTNVTVTTQEGYSSTIKVVVSPNHVVYRYDAQPLKSTNYSTSYVQNISNTVDGVNVQASIGTTNSFLWLGTNSSNVSSATISSSSAIGTALGSKNKSVGVVLYFNTNLSDVEKISYSQFSGTGSNNTLYVAYSTNSGSSYTLVSGSQTLGTGQETVSLEFSSVASAYYAIIIVSTSQILSKQPQVIFYSDAISDTEYVNNLISNIDDNDSDTDFTSELRGIAQNAYDGLSQSEKANVEHPEALSEETVDVTGVTLNQNSASLKVGDTVQLTATVAPNDATNKNVTWSSNNTSVASVSNTGLVTANATGSATITVTTEDGSKTATCAVTVNPTAVTGVTLNQNSATLVQGDTLQLEATVAPNDATNKNVTWSSNNTSVASVSNTGLVTANATGSATITVTTQDGSKAATCTVTVVKNASAVISEINSAKAEFAEVRVDPTDLSTIEALISTAQTDYNALPSANKTSVTNSSYIAAMNSAIDFLENHWYGVVRVQLVSRGVKKAAGDWSICDVAGNSSEAESLLTYYDGLSSETKEILATTYDVTASDGTVIRVGQSIEYISNLLAANEEEASTNALVVKQNTNMRSMALIIGASVMLSILLATSLIFIIKRKNVKNND